MTDEYNQILNKDSEDEGSTTLEMVSKAAPKQDIICGNHPKYSDYQNSNNEKGIFGSSQMRERRQQSPNLLQSLQNLQIDYNIPKDDINLRSLHSFLSSQNRNEDHNEMLDNACNIVSKHIGDDWKMLFRTLDYTSFDRINAVIDEIDRKYNGNLYEQSYQSLRCWRKHCGKQATLAKLEKCLKECDLVNIKDMLGNIRHSLPVHL